MAGYMDCPWSALLPNFHLKCAFLLPPFGNRACGLSLCMHLGHLPLPGFVVRLSPPWTYIGVCIPCTQEYFGGRYRRFLELKRALSQGICLSCARSKQHNDDLSLFYLQLHLMSASLHSHLPLFLPDMHTTHYPKNYCSAISQQW